MEALSSALNHLDASKLCKGLKLSVNGPSLSHLFSADDCLIFFQPMLLSCARLRDTLMHFGLFSGQSINHQKSSITLSPNIPRVFRHRFQSFFHIPVRTNLASYLGLSLGVSKNKRGCFQFIIDKTQQTLAGWKSTLSQAGKLTLIKSVLSSLPIYLCSYYKIPVAICDKLNAISVAFWWKTGDRNPLYWLSWDKISAYKSEGGLGIRDFRLLNQALLVNQCWRILNNPSLLISRILLPKYCSQTHLLNVKPHPLSSWAWKSILYGHDLISSHLSWIVGNGESINLYSDRWIPFFPKPLSHVIPYTGSSFLTVSTILNTGPIGIT